MTRHGPADPVMPSVSVIIPSHNRRGLIGRALRSVLDQTHAADEIIVVDDGSQDGTAQYLATQFPQVRCLRQGQQGVSAARNHGIRAARGSWIALLDSDDEWLPHKLERQLRSVPAATPVVHSDEIWIRNGRRVNARRRHAKHGGWIFRHCLPLCAISPSAALVHRSVFDAVGLFDETLPACEDYELWLRICARYPVHFLPEPLIVKHGGHTDQLSRRYWGMDRFRIQALHGVLQSIALSDADYHAAVQTLRDKTRIYLAGVRKRGRHAEAAHYQALLEHYGAAETLRPLGT